MNTKIQPKKVLKITCDICGELQIKIYPWSSITFKPDPRGIPPCQKCIQKELTKRNSTLKK
jgi:hypothetical protein